MTTASTKPIAPCGLHRSEAAGLRDDAPDRAAGRPTGHAEPFYDLGHFYATWLVDDGVPPNRVQRVMGHERSTTTLDLYTRRTGNSDRILRALDDREDDPGQGSADAAV